MIEVLIFYHSVDFWNWHLHYHLFIEVNSVFLCQWFRANMKLSLIDRIEAVLSFFRDFSLLLFFLWFILITHLSIQSVRDHVYKYSSYSQKSYLWVLKMKVLEYSFRYKLNWTAFHFHHCKSLYLLVLQHFMILLQQLMVQSF